jgi:hypothetical protein
MSRDSIEHRQQLAEESRASKEGVPVVEDRSGERRRAFIKAGLIGAPILLTLKGRKAWASSGASANSSSRHGPRRRWK